MKVSPISASKPPSQVIFESSCTGNWIYTHLIFETCIKHGYNSTKPHPHHALPTLTPEGAGVGGVGKLLPLRKGFEMQLI